jgi:predicted site-specific integrase-resolvase
MKIENAEDLERAGVALYGERHWKKDMAEDLGVNSSTVRRWSATGKIPKVVIAALECITESSGASGLSRIKAPAVKKRSAKISQRWRGKNE